VIQLRHSLHDGGRRLARLPDLDGGKKNAPDRSLPTKGPELRPQSTACEGRTRGVSVGRHDAARCSKSDTVGAGKHGSRMVTA
jgi:hypothetical protein